VGVERISELPGGKETYTLIAQGTAVLIKANRSNVLIANICGSVGRVKVGRDDGLNKENG
jgi:hypothetical protein